MNDSKIKVILVDDHQIVREGFKLILLLDDRFETIGEAESANALLTLLKEKTPDVIVLDISMPGLSGIEICKQIKSDSSSIKIDFKSFTSSPIIIQQHHRADYPYHN